MKHLGDITKINGYTAPPVDVVVGGSPCQDLSIAGKRQGLAGERSGLFMEQIRIVKEMRDAERERGVPVHLIRPRFMVWENVPGAFSSNKGEDFKAVLEETIRIAEPEAPDIPLPPKGKWPLADAYYGDGWSVAYRVLDAQFWGVPQRRRRIALVADFGGHAAPEILFIRKGVCGDIEESGTERERTARAVEGCADSTIPINLMVATRHKQLGRATGFGVGERGEKAFTISSSHSNGVFCLNDQGGRVMEVTQDKNATLRAQEHGHQPVICAGFKAGNGAKANGIGYEEEKSPTLSAVNSGTNQVPTVFCIAGNIVDREVNQNGTGIKENKSFTINTVDRRAVYAEPLPSAIVMATGQANAEKTYQKVAGAVAPTMTGDHNGRISDYSSLVFRQDAYDKWTPGNTMATLRAAGGAYGGGSENVCVQSHFVRRLTPLECERLQGFPDGWTDIGDWIDSNGKAHKLSDSARYKALGNSIALPPWTWVMKRISALYERPATLASLFDGIGGFPLIWERLNGKGTCLWASEIDSFCVAVTKRRFRDE